MILVDFLLGPIVRNCLQCLRIFFHWKNKIQKCKKNLLFCLVVRHQNSNTQARRIWVRVEWCVLMGNLYKMWKAHTDAGELLLRYVRNPWMSLCFKYWRSSPYFMLWFYYDDIKMLWNLLPSLHLLKKF